MSLVFLDGYCVTLTGKLEKGAVTLPASRSDQESLCEALGDDNHTYMNLVTTLGTEIIKVSCISGSIVLERAQGDSVEVTGGVGKCMCFRVSKPVLDDYIEELGIGTVNTCVPTIVTSNEDYITITAPEEGECEWTVDINEDFLERLNDCCPEDECNNCALSDGTYENATISVVNGRVCSVTTGTNIVYNGGGCCGCSDN